MRVEVERPLGRALTPREPVRRIRGERPEHLALDATVPCYDLGRPPAVPASIDQTVDPRHVEPAHLRQPALAAKHAGAVLLPVDDVRERVLHRPRVARGRARHAPVPVAGTQPSYEAIERRVLAPGTRDDGPLRVPHPLFAARAFLGQG